MKRRTFLIGAAATGATGFSRPAPAYESPYRLRFSLPESALAGGLDTPPWNDEAAQAAVPRDRWYDDAARERWGSWGPPARQYPAPAALTADPGWLGERLLYVAGRRLGLGYQHHHVPAWAPPGDWPWRPVRAGTDGPGLDCSNFSSFVFNTALGIKLPTGIGEQARTLAVGGPGGAGVAALRRIEPADYDDAVAALRPADLLFIRGDAGRVSHVVFWLGRCGTAPDGTPLILDCSDGGRTDAAGGRIPTGVRLRPFGPDTWYGRNFAHAHRLVDLGAGSGPAPAFAEGGQADP